jgi:hypothetical protein
MKNKLACIVTQGLLAFAAWKVVEKTVGDRPIAQWPAGKHIAAAALVPIGLLFADTVIERKFKVTNLDLFGSNAD